MIWEKTITLAYTFENTYVQKISEIQPSANEKRTAFKENFNQNRAKNYRAKWDRSRIFRFI